ncbi:hypothetical protein ACN47E_004436 [Coniothyrium glycines]
MADSSSSTRKKRDTYPIPPGSQEAEMPQANPDDTVVADPPQVERKKASKRQSIINIGRGFKSKASDIGLKVKSSLSTLKEPASPTKEAPKTYSNKGSNTRSYSGQVLDDDEDDDQNMHSRPTFIPDADEDVEDSTETHVASPIMTRRKAPTPSVTLAPALARFSAQATSPTLPQAGALRPVKYMKSSIPRTPITKIPSTVVGRSAPASAIPAGGSSSASASTKAQPWMNASQASQAGLSLPVQHPVDDLDEYGDVVYIPEGEQISQETVDHSKYASLALHMSETGWLPLAREVFYDEQLMKSSWIENCKMETWLHYADEVIATMHPSVLATVCSSETSLDQLERTDVAAKDFLNRYRICSKDRASIYVRELVIMDGDERRSLTVQNARDLATFTLQYVRESPVSDGAILNACWIDKRHRGKEHWHSKDSKAGHRAFLQDSNKKRHTGKVRVLQAWARGLLKLAKDAEAEKRACIPFLRYVGYALDGNQRAKQHDSLQTSWLYLFARIIMPKLNLKFEMCNFTVCVIPEEAAAPVAEMLVTRMARAYYFAGGFSIGQAGASVKSMALDKLTDAERKAKFAGFIDFATKKTTLYDDNIKRELSLRKRLWSKDWDDKIKEAENKAITFQKEVEEMKDFATKFRSEINADFWAKEFPDEYKKLTDLEEYVETTTSALKKAME